MKTFKKDWLLLLFLLLAIVYLFFIWSELPKKVPISWDYEGRITQYGSKYTFPIFFVLMPIVIYALLSLAPYIDPKMKLMQMGAKYLKLKVIISLFMVSLSVLFLYQIQRENLYFNSSFIFIGIGLLISLLGNYFKTIKPNYFIGIRTPWTLEDEIVWKKVHHTAGILWFVAGILIVLLALSIDLDVFQYILPAIVMVIALAPVIQSFILFKIYQK
ncbi:MAG: SdpI family protein [Bacteroidetes bacterium]|nr:SdpI family protein [Bacteroidota bacterium]